MGLAGTSLDALSGRREVKDRAWSDEARNFKTIIFIRLFSNAFGYRMRHQKLLSTRVVISNLYESLLKACCNKELTWTISEVNRQLTHHGRKHWILTHERNPIQVHGRGLGRVNLSPRGCGKIEKCARSSTLLSTWRGATIGRASPRVGASASLVHRQQPLACTVPAVWCRCCREGTHRELTPRSLQA